MVDIVFLLQMAWCMVVASTTTAKKALMYSGGALACGNVSWKLTPWFAHVFAPPMSPAMLWIQSHVTPDVESAMASLSLMPPEPVSVGQTMMHSQWVAYHIVRILCFIMLNLSVVLLFVVVSHVTDAVWDAGTDAIKHRRSMIALLLGVCSGLYTVVLTGLLIANLSWIGSFAPIAKEAGQSVIIQWLAQITAQIHGFS